jgi:hypothetical protein
VLLHTPSAFPDASKIVPPKLLTRLLNSVYIRGGPPQKIHPSAAVRLFRHTFRSKLRSQFQS